MKQYSEDEFVLAARLGYNACLADLLGKDMNQTDIALESNILCVCLGVDYKFNPETFRREVIFEKMASYKELFDYFTLGFVICLATLKNCELT